MFFCDMLPCVNEALFQVSYVPYIFGLDPTMAGGYKSGAMKHIVSSCMSWTL